MAESSIPAELRYSTQDEWARADGERVVVGITDFAQQQLGDVVFVELPKVGAKVRQRQAFGVVESVKAVSDLFSPVSGEVVEANGALPTTPETVNADPYGTGWMIVITPSKPAELDELLSAAQYEEFIAKGGH